MRFVAALQRGLHQRRGGGALQHRRALRLYPARFATRRTALSSPCDPPAHSGGDSGVLRR